MLLGNEFACANRLLTYGKRLTLHQGKLVCYSPLSLSVFL
jgi:hypothetical protein